MSSTQSVAIGKDITLDIDFSKMPQAALDHILYIGARNILMDSHAGINAKALPELSPADVVAQSRAIAERKLAALYAGEVRTQRATRESVDPVKAEAIKIASGIIRAALKAKSINAKDIDKAKMESMVAGLLAKRPDILETAATRVAENAALRGPVDLADLGL